MITDEERKEPKSAFNKRYGEWMREMREESNLSIEDVAAGAGVDVNALRAIETGSVIELYDTVRLCDYFSVDE